MGSTSTAISPKVAAAAIAGAIATILVWLIGLTGVDVPPEVSAAIATALAGGAGYLTRDRARDVGQVVIEDTKAVGEPTFDPPVREELDQADADAPGFDAGGYLSPQDDEVHNDQGQPEPLRRPESDDPKSDAAHHGGTAWVGEKGPELIDFKGDEKVYRKDELP